MDKILSYLQQVSTWTGGSSLGLLAGMVGVEDVRYKALCGLMLAIINVFDVIREEKN